MRDKAIIIIIMLLFLIVGFLLQIFFSKNKNKWVGLIIPILCFIFSITTVLSLSMYKNTEIIAEIEDIESVTAIDETIPLQSDKPPVSMLATVLPIFLICNIPTLILLAVYFDFKDKLKFRKKIDKMNVKDLE